MAQQTAVEWFFDKLKNHEIQSEHFELYQQAKQKEREQHNNSWVDGNNTQRCNSTKETNDCFDNYYNETYNQNK